jgi:methyl-accepting chemotaxis protein/methyl-accepting chemotaxis protein-3 (ribose and galactose sensor receptor)
VADHIERIASMVETSASAARNAQHNAGRLEALASALNQAVARFTVSA